MQYIVISDYAPARFECGGISLSMFRAAHVLETAPSASHNTASPKLVEDLECARDWLLPGRPVKQIEIDNCISELNDIINQLSGIA